MDTRSVLYREFFMDRSSSLIGLDHLTKSALTLAGQIEVSILAQGRSPIGQVGVTLPEGFIYLGSDLSEAAVSEEGRTVAFTLFLSISFTYVVTAPADWGTYTFSETIKNQDREVMCGAFVIW